jgi:hypothetical protein
MIARLSQGNTNSMAGQKFVIICGLPEHFCTINVRKFLLERIIPQKGREQTSECLGPHHQTFQRELKKILG